jgi:hypothetical protein
MREAHRVAKPAEATLAYVLGGEKEAEIMRARGRGETYKEIGDEFGLSPQRIRQIVTKSCRKLRAVWMKGHWWPRDPGIRLVVLNNYSYLNRSNWPYDFTKEPGSENLTPIE